MKTRIISFHNGNLNPDLLYWQKRVFDKFNIPLEQIETKLSHGEAIDHFLNTEDWDRVVLFDADCIPVNPDIINWGLARVALRTPMCLFGSAQKSSHISGSKIFVAPSFLILKREVWEQVNKCSFKPISGAGDVAEVFSRTCEHYGIELSLLMPWACEKPMWDLNDEVAIGYGTTYGNEMIHDGVYHAFESNANHHSTSRFIEKCKEVCGG